ncbi:MAG: DUF1289 domain-containing protein [Gammaproteobacteria bacterium]|nr:DUF1289 domain-containing protein [Gammaproteobacteria bacterium]
MPAEHPRQSGGQGDDVPSPCVGICIVGAEGHCIGCFRDRKELQAWWIAGGDEKRAILARCTERAARAAGR